MWGIIVAAALFAQIQPTPLPGYVQRPAAAAVKPRVYGPELPPKAVVTTPAPDTTDAVAWAVLDLKMRQARGEDTRFLRYLWIPPWGGKDLSWHQVNSLVVNAAVSQAPVIVLPDGGAEGWLIVWDLKQLAPRAHDLERLLIVWDALAISEPYFHVALPDGFTLAVPPYKHIDGKTYTGVKFAIAPHVQEGYALLAKELRTPAPLLRADDFLRRVSSSVELEGGLYYHFIGFVRDGKRLTESEIDSLIGLNNTVSRQVEGDDRAAMFQSGITGKGRMIECVQGAVGRKRTTFDLFDEDVDADRHPLYEIIQFVDSNRARGKEIIFDRPNGLHGYLLSDGAGKLVDVAPPNLATDHRTPPPVTGQLFPPLSCIRCHGPNDGVQPVRNDVATLLADGLNGGPDYFGELFGREGREFDVARAAGLFAAGQKFENDLADARMRLADAVWAATMGMDIRGKDHVVDKAFATWAEQYAAYWYPRSPEIGNVTPDQAALELGYQCEPGEGAAVLKNILPVNRVDVIIDGRPIEFVDPSLSALKRGLSIRRQDWQRVYAYAAYLVVTNRKGR